MKVYSYLIVAFSLLILACQSPTKTDTSENTDSTKLVENDSNTIAKDSLSLVKANYERIHAIQNWDKIDSAQIHESTEGGQVNYYFKNNVLEKMRASHYGESGFTHVDYYLLNNELSFVFEDVYQYNAHMYSPEFDNSKTKKGWENRFYYFDNVFFKFIGTKEQEADHAGTADRAKVHQDMFKKFLKIKDDGYKDIDALP